MRDRHREQRSTSPIVRVLGLFPPLVLAVACGAPAPQQESRAPAGEPVEPIHCTPFQWQAVEGLSDYAAIRVPVLHEKKQLNFQLNTGTDLSTISAAAAKASGIEYTPDDAGVAFTKPVLLEVGGVTLSLQLLVEQKSERVDPAGSLGLNLLSGKVIVLDFPGRSFCISPPDSPGAQRIVREEFTPADLRDGKLFLEFELNGEPVRDVFYDTSASAFPLSVDLDRWKKLTGGEGTETTNEKLEVHSGDKTFTFVGAPALGEMAIGGGHIAHPMVYFQPDQPAYFAGLSSPAGGLLGNALFLQNVVVLDLRGPSLRFGLLTSPSAGTTNAPGT